MKECIILAGGFGTRLQSVVKDVPKCMADIADKPFLYYMLRYLEKEQFDHVILSLGYKSEIIIDWLQSVKFSFEISYVIESKPLGTGGAIKYAQTKVQSNSFFIANGDTFFDVDTDELAWLHNENKSDISIALKHLSDFERYGTVVLNEEQRIIAFKEKQYCEEGLINGGIYLINKNIFDNITSESFSFEKDILEKKIADLRIFGLPQQSYFIDIGIPSDYEKANIDFKTF